LGSGFLGSNVLIAVFRVAIFIELIVIVVVFFDLIDFIHEAEVHATFAANDQTVGAADDATVRQRDGAFFVVTLAGRQGDEPLS
jgi:hypothetical protein